MAKKTIEVKSIDPDTDPRNPTIAIRPDSHYLLKQVSLWRRTSMIDTLSDIIDAAVADDKVDGFTPQTTTKRG